MMELAIALPQLLDILLFILQLVLPGQIPQPYSPIDSICSSPAMILKVRLPQAWPHHQQYCRHKVISSGSRNLNA